MSSLGSASDELLQHQAVAEDGKRLYLLRICVTIDILRGQRGLRETEWLWDLAGYLDQCRIQVFTSSIPHPFSTYSVYAVDLSPSGVGCPD